MRGQIWKPLFWLFLYAAGGSAALLLNWGSALGTPGRAAGAAVVTLAVALSASAGRHLRVYGKSSPRAGFGEVDRLVTSGIYSCVRHPNHLGLALLPLGLGLLLDSLSYLLVAAPVQSAAAVAFVYLVEEPEVRAKFGPEYEEYARKVRGLLPDARCLAKNLLSWPRARKDGAQSEGETPDGMAVGSEEG